MFLLNAFVECFCRTEIGGAGILGADRAEGAPQNRRSLWGGEGKGGSGNIRHDPLQPPHA